MPLTGSITAKLVAISRGGVAKENGAQRRGILTVSKS